jgi:hypothetical protein
MYSLYVLLQRQFIDCSRAVVLEGVRVHGFHGEPLELIDVDEWLHP